MIIRNNWQSFSIPLEICRQKSPFIDSNIEVLKD